MLTKKSIQNALELHHEYVVSNHQHGKPATLNNTDLSNMEFENLNLSQINLKHSNLSNATFKNCILNNAFLAHTNLSNVSFTNIEAVETTFDYSDMENFRVLEYNKNNFFKSTFRETNLTNAHLQCVNLEKCDFSGSNLTNANLVNVRGKFASFINANLTCAQLHFANFELCDFSNANATKANFNHTKLNNAFLVDAILREADLKGAVLYGTSLSGAQMQNTVWDYSSGLTLSCLSLNFQGDDRLFAQLLFHLTRIDWSNCSGGIRETADHLKTLAASDLFCEYREDIDPL